MAEYIEREDVIDQFENGEADVMEMYPDGSVDFGFSVSNIRDMINAIPAADVASVVHGRWDRVIPSKSAAKWSSKVSCSVCHNAGYNHFKYCPNCGAKMDEEVAE